MIQGGRIVQERAVAVGTQVTVGEAPGATLVVPRSARVGRRQTLFQTTGGKYALSFNDKADGWIVINDAEVDLETLRQKRLAKKRGELYFLPLVARAKGSIDVGEITVAFDFVEPSAPPPRLRLPASVRSSFIGSFDVVLSAALAVSTLLFGLLLAWLSTIPVPEEITFDQIDDKFAQMIMPKIKEPEPTKDETKAIEKKEEKKKEEKKEEKKVDPEDKEAVAARKKEIQEKVAGKGVLAILGTKGMGNGAVADVFSDGSKINTDLDSAFANIGGVEMANGSNTTSRGAGGGGTSTSIGALATSGSGKVGMAAKTEARVAEVKLTEAPEVDGSLDQADIARVVRGRLTAIKECYERELKRNPQLSGKVIVRFTIDEEGRVSQAVIEENTLPEKSVATCVAQRVERFRFPKPDGGSVTVAYPFIFSPST